MTEAAKQHADEMTDVVKDTLHYFSPQIKRIIWLGVLIVIVLPVVLFGVYYFRDSLGTLFTLGDQIKHQADLDAEQSKIIDDNQERIESLEDWVSDMEAAGMTPAHLAVLAKRVEYLERGSNQ